MAALVQDQDIIFNLAGQVSHIDSMRDPHTDLDINCRAQLSMLEACRRHNPSSAWSTPARVRSTAGPIACRSTRQHLVRPADINGVNKAAGEYYHLLYNNVFGVRACSLRLTNVYGPRQLIKHNRQGFIGWFIRLASRTGRSRCSVTARSCATSSTSTMRRTRSCAPGHRRPATASVFNVGGDEPIAIAISSRCWSRRPAAAASATSSGRPRRSASTSAASIPTRRKFQQAVGWRPQVPLARRPPPDDRLLSRAHAALRRCAGDRGAGDPVPAS